MNILGAIIGDICGSVYEWHNEIDPEKIELFKDGCRPTDDSVLTCAVMDWLRSTNTARSDKEKEVLIKKLREYAQEFPKAGYGGMFRKWITQDNDEPIGSFGNGSAMRVSACGFIAKSIEEAMDLAEKSAMVTHNHPEGVKGAQATAVAIFRARKGVMKSDIVSEIEEIFGYDLHTPLAERPKHKFDATCQVTVPEAIRAFVEGDDFEDVIIKAIAIGGDSDTIATIAGGIAGAYYGIPSYIIESALEILPAKLFNAVTDFEDYCLVKLK